MTNPIVELCAKVCDEEAAHWREISHSEGEESGAICCAAAIRAIPESEIAAVAGEPVAWEYCVNSVHTCYSSSRPPEDAYDEGTLRGLVYASRMEPEQEKDSIRLEAMSKYGWQIGWTREGEHCRVFHLVEEDGWEPVCGWNIFFTNFRTAVDAAMLAACGKKNT